jgi:hypothetical protein
MAVKQKKRLPPTTKRPASRKTKRPASRKPKRSPAKEPTQRTPSTRPSRTFLSAEQFAKILQEFESEVNVRVRDVSRAPADATRVQPKKKAKRSGRATAPDTGFDPCMTGTTTRLCTPIRNQQNTDLCIAFAVAAAMETAVCRTRDTTNGIPEINVDHVFRKNGAQVGSVSTIQGAVKTGVFDVVCLPLGSTQPCVDTGAHMWKCDLLPVQALEKDRVRVMKETLRNTGPLVSLIQVFDGFADGMGVDPYGPTSEPSAGFHAVCIVGYEVDPGGATGRWIAKNSMGAGWGSSGFFRIPWRHARVKPESVVFVASNVRQ